MPKILLSASSEEREVDEAYRLGVNTSFQKPVSLNQFRELVYHLLLGSHGKASDPSSSCVISESLNPAKNPNGT